jgi:hypothetical protein
MNYPYLFNHEALSTRLTGGATLLHTLDSSATLAVGVFVFSVQFLPFVASDNLSILS